MPTNSHTHKFLSTISFGLQKLYWNIFRKLNREKSRKITYDTDWADTNCKRVSREFPGIKQCVIWTEPYVKIFRNIFCGKLSSFNTKWNTCWIWWQRPYNDYNNSNDDDGGGFGDDDVDIELHDSYTDGSFGYCLLFYIHFSTVCTQHTTYIASEKLKIIAGKKMAVRQTAPRTNTHTHSTLPLC